MTELGIDPTDPGFLSRPDLHDVFARLRAAGPLHRVGAGPAGATWLVVTYDEVRAISRDPARFCSGRGVLVNDPMRTGRQHGAPSILHLDPPDHGPHRQLVNRRFTPRAVGGLEARIRELATDVLAGLPARAEPIDLVEHVTAPFPLLVIAEILGIPDGDRPDFRRWSDATIESPDRPPDEGAVAVGELVGFLVQLIHERRTRPGDDVVSAIVTGTVGDRTLSTDEALVFCLALLVAGNETTRHLLSGALAELHRHPDQRELLVADRSLLPAAVEECLRWVTPIQAMGRTATQPVTVGDAPVAEGDFLVLLYGSANRDEAVFGPTAHQFDVRRDPEPPHLSFGFGEHLCLGAALARIEARVLLEELLRRYPDYELVGEPTWESSTLVRGMATLPGVLRP